MASGGRSVAAVSAREAVAAKVAAAARRPLAAIEPTPAQLASLRPAAPARSARFPASEAIEPAAGAYVGGAADGSRHRVTFSVRDGDLRNLRVDGRDMAPRAEITDARVEAHHLGFQMSATWVTDGEVEGEVRVRGRWGRRESFAFRARQPAGRP